MTVDMINPMKYIREYYGVPAEIGGRVIFNCPGIGPRHGTITGAQNAHIRIKLDGEKVSKPYHPTWNLTYV